MRYYVENRGNQVGILNGRRRGWTVLLCLPISMAEYRSFVRIYDKIR
jgi:hypothetical protein